MSGWICVAVIDLKASFRWKKRKRRGQGRSSAPFRCLHMLNVCVWGTVRECVCTWCITGTKTEQRPGQQTCSGSQRRKVSKESQKRLKLEAQGSLQTYRKEANLSKLQHQLIHYHEAVRQWPWTPPGRSKRRSILSKVFSTFWFVPQNQRFGYMTVRNVKTTWNYPDRPDSKEWEGHCIVLLCLYRKAGREGCPTQALFDKQRKLRVSPCWDTFHSAFTDIF